jgi:hypothetical protein
VPGFKTKKQGLDEHFGGKNMKFAANTEYRGTKPYSAPIIIK